MRKNLRSVLVLSVLLLAGTQKLAAQQQAAPAPSKFQLTSAFYDEDWMPVQYSCANPDGASPKLQWTGAPAGTASFALIFHDMDAAPAKSVMDVTHWIVWNIPANATELAAGIQPDSSPDGMQQGKNIRGVNGYQPPCPPVGRPHHYVFELYALDTKLDLPAGSSRADLLKALDGHVIGKASMVGIFGQGVDEKAWPWEVVKLPEQ